MSTNDCCSSCANCASNAKASLGQRGSGFTNVCRFKPFDVSHCANCASNAKTFLSQRGSGFTNICRFKPFDVKSMALDSTSLIIGPRGTGKTIICNQIMETLEHKTRIIVDSSPECANKYRQWPKEWRYAGLNTAQMDKIVQTQHQLMVTATKSALSEQDVDTSGLAVKYKGMIDCAKQDIDGICDKHHLNASTRKQMFEDSSAWLKFNYDLDVKELLAAEQRKKLLHDCGVLMVWDGYDAAPLKSDSMKQFLFNNRHYAIGNVFSLQYVLDFPAKYRGSVDYLFLTKDHGKKCIQRIYEKWASVFFSTFDEFLSTFNEMTDDYGVMVLYMRGTDMNNAVFSFKPSIKTKEPSQDQKYSENKQSESSSTIFAVPDHSTATTNTPKETIQPLATLDSAQETNKTPDPMLAKWLKAIGYNTYGN